MIDGKKHIAVFITPHGYGHAGRAAAAMDAIRTREPEVIFEIFTRVPVWFFNMSLGTGFNYHEVITDIGLVQTTSMTENLPETIKRLSEFLPFSGDLVRQLAEQVLLLGCESVICDIAPLGIAVAREAGLHAVLIENFTWDWIYAGYLDEAPGLAPYVTYLRQTFASANLHIRTEPACDETLAANLVTHPVSRKPRSTREETRARLGAALDQRMVMITMGGILTEYPFLDRLEHSKDVLFLIPGGSDTYEQRGSLILIPHHSNIYHPDMVEASDAVIGKLGYSTLAEAYAASAPFVFIPRAHFPESPPLAAYAKRVMNAVELEEARFFNGEWLDLLPKLFSRPRQKPSGPNGADQIAEFLRA